MSKRYQKKRNMETGLLILNQHKKIQEMSSVGNIKMSSACGCKGESSSSSTMKCQSLNTQVSLIISSLSSLSSHAIPPPGHATLSPDPVHLSQTQPSFLPASLPPATQTSLAQTQPSAQAQTTWNQMRQAGPCWERLSLAGPLGPWIGQHA